MNGAELLLLYQETVANRIDYVKENAVLFMDYKSLSDGAANTWTSVATNTSYTASKVSATGPVKSSGGLFFNNSEYMKIPNLDLSGSAKYSIYIVHTMNAQASGVNRVIIDHGRLTTAKGFYIANPIVASQVLLIANVVSGTASTNESAPLIGTKVITELTAGTTLAEKRNSVNNGTAITFDNNLVPGPFPVNDCHIGALNNGAWKFINYIDCIIIIPFETSTEATKTKLWLAEYYGITF